MGGAAFLVLLLFLVVFFPSLLVGGAAFHPCFGAVLLLLPSPFLEFGADVPSTFGAVLLWLALLPHPPLGWCCFSPHFFSKAKKGKVR